MDTESFTLQVVDVVEETADARSITLALPPGAEEHFAHSPGQFLTVAVPSERTGVVARCYSLSSSPGAAALTITVKRTTDGYASHWLCDHVRPGATLRVLPPSGIFTPASLDADLLLLAGGSGITPVISIVRTALAQGSGRLVLLYANRDESSVIFAAELAALAAAHPDRLQVVHWLESVQGLPTQAQVRAFATAYASYDAFVCGPAPFMRIGVAALKELGFPRARRHQERFVSLDGNPFGDLHDVEVAEHEIHDAETDPEDETGDDAGTRTRAGSARPSSARAALPGSRSSSTAASTPSTTGHRAPGCSTTSRPRASSRRTPAGRASARPAPCGWSRARCGCWPTTCSARPTSTPATGWAASRCRSPTPCASPTADAQTTTSRRAKDHALTSSGGTA